VIIPVFKTGVSRVLPGSGRFDSDTLPPFIFSGLAILELAGIREPPKKLAHNKAHVKRHSGKAGGRFRGQLVLNPVYDNYLRAARLYSTT